MKQILIVSVSINLLRSLGSIVIYVVEFPKTFVRLIPLARPIDNLLVFLIGKWSSCPLFHLSLRSLNLGDSVDKFFVISESMYMTEDGNNF